MLQKKVETEYAEGCAKCTIRSKSLFGALTEDEVFDVVYSSGLNKSSVQPKTVLFYEGSKAEKCYTLYSGWMILFKNLKTGKRQIINFILPGDFIGFEIDENENHLYSLETLTECDLCTFSYDNLKQAMRENLSLLQGYNQKLLQRNKICAQHLINVGRMDSKQKLAAILLELFDRTDFQLDEQGRSYMFFPPTQEELADALGLTQVHVNRVMRSMVDEKIISFRKKHLTILDENKLQKIATV